jgi:predicted metal-dependent HD superfamily phosphohydrolase
MVKMPEFEKARNYVLNRLENELSPNLTYHSLKHTLEVVSAADRLATLEKVGEEDHLLLLTGAYYHDLGFIHQRQGHESISIQLAEQTLPEFGYSDADVVVIRGIIQATCLPQSPTNLLEMIMADADLDYLGDESFWERSQDLRQELENFGNSFTDADWYAYQLNFIHPHQYFTASQWSLREPLKQQHMIGIKKLLDSAIKNKLIKS